MGVEVERGKDAADGPRARLEGLSASGVKGSCVGSQTRIASLAKCGGRGESRGYFVLCRWHGDR